MFYQVSVSAAKLSRGGGWSLLPDPYAVITQNGGTLGKSEPVLRTKQPEFAKTFYLNANNGINAPLQVDIFNEKNGRKLATATFDANEVRHSKGSMKVVEDTKSGAKIYMSVRNSVRGDALGTASLHIRGLDMKNVVRSLIVEPTEHSLRRNIALLTNLLMMDYFTKEPGILGLGRSDPYLEVSKKDADHASGIVQWTVVHRSRYINNHLNPYWDPFQLSLEELCYCDVDWPLKLTVWDFQRNGAHRVIGEVETTLALLTQTIAIKGNADRERALEISGESKSKSRHRKTRGLLVVLQADVQLEESNSF